LGGYGMILVAVLLALLSAWVAGKQYSLLSSWSRADAEIANSELYSDVIHQHNGDQTRLSPVFGFRCSVRFQANGRSYESQADIGYEKSAKDEMIDWHLRFPAGSHTIIAYDPANPSRVKLAEDFQTSYAAPLASSRYAAWILLFGLPMALISRELRRQQRCALEDLQEQSGSN
jgi:hypothetical protein